MGFSAVKFICLGSLVAFCEMGSIAAYAQPQGKSNTKVVYSGTGVARGFGVEAKVDIVVSKEVDDQGFIHLKEIFIPDDSENEEPFEVEILMGFDENSTGFGLAKMNDKKSVGIVDCREVGSSRICQIHVSSKETESDDNETSISQTFIWPRDSNLESSPTINMLWSRKTPGTFGMPGFITIAATLFRNSDKTTKVATSN